MVISEVGKECLSKALCKYQTKMLKHDVESLQAFLQNM